MLNKEITEALLRAFNVNNYFSDTVKTNFTLQKNKDGKNYIAVAFDKGMRHDQCVRYLNDIKRKIIREFYGIEDGSNKEILDTAKLIFDVNSFPFNISKGSWSKNKQGRIVGFVTLIDEGVIFNLKSHLAFSLKKDVQEDMQIYINTKKFDKKKYLWCGEFPNRALREQFVEMFLSRMKQRYKNVPDGLLKFKGNDVYIRDVFAQCISEEQVKDYVCFINSITQRAAWLVGRDLQANSKTRDDVKVFKDLMIRFINQSIEAEMSGFICARPLSQEEASVLIPLINSDEGPPRLLTSEEAFSLNKGFGSPVLDNVNDRIQGELSINGDREVYAIDFSDPEISYCVINKIIETSVINEMHELSINSEHCSQKVLSDATKEKILISFIKTLSAEKIKKEALSPFLVSSDKKQELYSILSSPSGRKELYSECNISKEQSENLELNWHLFHNGYLTPPQSPGAKDKRLKAIEKGGSGGNAFDSPPGPSLVGPSTSQQRSNSRSSLGLRK